MRISDWSSDVCSSDLLVLRVISGEGCKSKSNFFTLHHGAYKMLRRGIQMLHTAITAILKHEFKAIHVSKPGNSREGEEYRLSAFYLLCHFLSETRCDGTIILDGAPVFLVFGSDKAGAVWCRLGVGDKVESSEERRVGKECVSRCRSRGWRCN